MRQLLLRVPEELHAGLSDRAATVGRSVNALAGDILAAAVLSAAEDRRARLRARLAATGHRPTANAGRVSADRRDVVLASTSGLGPVVDVLLADADQPS